jgi:hypothetical protein
MGTRRAIVAAGVAIAVVIALLVWRSHDAKPHASAEVVPASELGEKAGQPTAASAVQPPPALVAPADPVEAAQPQPVPLGGSATPPALDGKRSDPAAPQKPFTPDETIAKREADLKLLDDTKARLDEQLAAARTAKDAAAIHDLEVRLARLSDLRKKRGDELDKLRAGSGSAR